MARGPRLSLWLVPTGAAHERAARLIRELSDRLGTPRFEPHLTLLGGLGRARADAERQAALAAGRLRPFTVRLTRVGQRAEYFRSLFVEAARTPELLEARAVAEEAFGAPRGAAFAPHLSLLYSRLSRPQKEPLLAEVGREWHAEFRAEALHLFSTAGDPPHWHAVARFPLG